MKRATTLSIAIGVAAIVAVGIVAWQAVRGPATFDLGSIDRYAFVASRDAAEVTVIDIDDDEIVGTIVLAEIADQIAVSDVSGLLIASNVAARSLSLYDLETQALATKLDLNTAPETMALSPDRWQVAVTGGEAGRLVIVSLSKRQVQATIGGLDHPTRLTFSDDGAVIYVADTGSQSVKLIDVDQGKLVGAIAVADSPVSDAASIGGAVSALTRTPNGRFGFTALQGRGEVSVLDLNSHTKIKDLYVGKNPSRPWGTADGRYMLVANDGDRSISVIDTQSFEVAATLAGAADVIAINTGFFESVAFAVSASENRAVVLDLMDLTNVGEIPLGAEPGPGVVSADGQKMYVALGEANAVAVIDTRERRLIKTIEGVGHRPFDVTMARTNNYCH